MKRSTLSHSFLNIILVFIESALTLLLRLDPELRKAAYPLAKQGTVVALRLYLPHVEVFATFSTKGVLLDASCRLVVVSLTWLSTPIAFKLSTPSRLMIAKPPKSYRCAVSRFKYNWSNSLLCSLGLAA
ncbi:hypothetical protein [Psychrobacter sp. JCM 18901]|uniref:hypothetical protein n=1 Tax=Psychrobacter sp. JCM 18901 TaxID=1298609 RepID=UPI0021C2BD43|nr:hypothetical protein [Psychrobacter sp. JCM 18901]